MGRAFAAVIKLDENHAPSFDFGNDEGDDGEPVDFSGQEALGACPKCQSKVYDQPMAYVCEKSVGPAKSCDFRSGKVILQQEISKAEMQKLLNEGKTSLLKGFVSNRTKRKFSAFLVREKNGKVGFEFEERKFPPKAAKAKASAAAPQAPQELLSVIGAGGMKSPAAGTAAAPKKTAAKPAAKKPATKKVTKAPAKAR